MFTKTTKFLAVAAFLVAGVAHGATMNTETYETKEAAATAAVQYALTQEQANTWEYAGCIVRVDDRFTFTMPTTDRDSQNSTFQCAGVSHIVAFYHTHPNSKFSMDVNNLDAKNRENFAKFSPEDIRVAKTYKIPSFIGVDTGTTVTIKVYIAGQTKTADGETL